MKSTNSSGIARRRWKRPLIGAAPIAMLISALVGPGQKEE
jgi:hypothetical protein